MTNSLMTNAMPATLLCDFYKVSHKDQYPEGTEYIYSTWTPRRSLVEGIEEVVAFGFQSFIKKYLIGYFNENFFGRSKEDVVAEYKRVIKFTLGIPEVDASHIEALHDLGYLPIKIKAVKEGTLVPLRVPMLTIENTHKDFFWLTNYLETLLSAELWMPTTSATIAFQYRKILTAYAKRTVGHAEDVPFQGHDFSMRGMASLEAAAASGAGHLLSFTGTDTIPAILYHEAYYNADIENELVGASIPATEHSVMCASGQDEYSSFKRLITEVYPAGFVSIVSDTWDFWSVIGNVIPSLKEEIMNRDGRLVIRPDSGDPVLILCGDENAKEELVRKGLIESLWDIFGGTVSEQGYKVLDPHIGAIYGDAITLERAEEICARLEAKGFASTNVVLGMGSFSYQYRTRDSFGFAVKATYSVVDGVEKMIFKDPKTDNGTKKSQKGLVAVTEDEDGNISYFDNMVALDYLHIEDEDLLEVVFEDGTLVRNEFLSDIRARVLNKLI